MIKYKRTLMLIYSFVYNWFSLKFYMFVANRVIDYFTNLFFIENYLPIIYFWKNKWKSVEKQSQ